MDKMKRTTYSEEFKIEAIKLVLEGGATVPEVAGKLGIKPNQLYNWMQSHRLPGEIKAMISKQKDLEAEIKQLKKAAQYFAKEAQ